MITPEQVRILWGLMPDRAPIIGLADLTDQSERTLIYGYTTDRETHHVYIKDGAIRVVRYFFEKPPVLVPVTCNQDYAPGKRVYPTRSDFEFCSLLARKDVDLSYTNCDEKELTRIKGNYFGEILE